MKVKLLFDSGAYSAWKKGVTIEVGEYIKFVKDHLHLIDRCVNLDVIPAEFGRTPTSEEVEDSAERGWSNFLEMRKAELNPIPVFHQGERMVWLDKMIEYGCDYVGISPANDRTTSQKKEWLDDVFSFLCDNNDGYAPVKTHAFGVTAVELMFRYPWYSVDSATWLLLGAYGAIYVPKWRKGKFRHDLTPQTVAVSSLRSDRALRSGVHYDTLGKETQKRILQYIEEAGLTLEEVQDNYSARQHMIVKYFKQVAEDYVPGPFRRDTVKGFFS